MTEITIPSALIGALKNAKRIAILTGAGVSAESGIPTFRDAQTGFWSKFDPQDLASLDAFEKDPKLIWQWYEERREYVRKAEPNPGHVALAALAELKPELTLITQNVDNLHQRAGSRNVLQLHGSLFEGRTLYGEEIIDLAEPLEALPPKHPVSGEMLRPAIVWFGEYLPERVLDDSMRAAEECDLFLVIGTSALVQPAASIPMVAKHHGAVLVDINPEPSAITDAADYFLSGPSGKVLPALIKCLQDTDSQISPAVPPSVL